ncbi:serine hydrolase domain-containing protein [Marinigracilibium pacificum]|uniref:Beta-lactamase family protein n=1 Tax=Marinigracilibium pacificum TaxID=2729599 RepID=A0A848J416_9BACT|nr:serine hydrolase domain-containing protein [Marinigracilibium pacificum]NMM47922.1 beta-lactamase family protein [Marinigracilibium pacificum]
MRFLYSLALLIFISKVSVAQIDSELNKLIEETLHEEKLVGASWSTFDNGVISTGAVGLKNASTQVKLSPDDKIQIGSITKTLIATGVLRLVTQKKLSLETPVEKIVPDISFDNPWKATHRVTVKDLLNHTSGLPDAEFWQIFSVEAKSNTPLIDVFNRDKDVLKIRTKPGSRFSYSNLGYTLLGMVIEEITKEPYESYLDRNLLAPLGMKNSTFQFISQNDNPDLAMGHFDGGTTQNSIPMYLRPAGQFSTTAYDMSLFAQFLLSDGKINGQTFIAPEFLNVMGKPNTTEANQQGLDRGYQFGLSYRDRYGVIGRYHAGNIVGYQATFYLFPEENKAFFISFNTDSESADYQKFNEIFAENLNVNQPEILKSKSQNSSDIDSFEGHYILSPVRFESYIYLDLISNSILVKHDPIKNKLNVHSLQQSSYSLFPYDNNLFRKEDRVRHSHIFYEQDGKVVYSDGLSTYEKENPFFLGLLWLNLILGLFGLLGIIAKGVSGIFSKRHFLDQGISVPFISVLLLFLPIPFFFMQSPISIGDLTAGSLLLTICTAILPLGLIFGLVNIFRKKEGYWKIDALVVCFLFQWVCMLVYWGLIPFKLWEL